MELQDSKIIQEAMSRPDKDEWKAAMDDKINSLNINKTWELAEMPHDREPIEDANGFSKLSKMQMEIHANIKQDWLLKGSQKYSTDYDEVFAPVVRPTTFRTLLVIAGNRNFIVKHIDAKTAFLNGELENVIYMRQPKDNEVPDKEHMVCKLNKCIYRLKQAARVWNEKLHTILEGHGFKQSQTDPCLYSKVVDNIWIYLIIYVNDIIIGSKEERVVSDTIDLLRKNFNIIDLGNLRNYLGMSIKRDDKGIFYLNQPRYIKRK
ncbi:retrotransposon ty1-copia subclass [Lasius niger]|uniref:Retrotransposon ty1-copia subclass n=1 Tax=Lasius niger TaxID=67767 RepID=A0A0J7K257_LASNI|nr:retrotransposon ty1-copia subclass [Lasius niger]